MQPLRDKNRERKAFDFFSNPEEDAGFIMGHCLLGLAVTGIPLVYINSHLLAMAFVVLLLFGLTLMFGHARFWRRWDFPALLNSERPLFFLVRWWFSMLYNRIPYEYLQLQQKAVPPMPPQTERGKRTTKRERQKKAIHGDLYLTPEQRQARRKQKAEQHKQNRRNRRSR